MTSKMANWLFLTLVLTHIGVAVFYFFFGGIFTIGIIANLFLGEAVLVVPAFLFLLFAGQKPTGQDMALRPVPNGSVLQQQPARTGAFRRIKISSLLMIALCTFLIMPLVVVLNALSLFFTDNAMAAIQGDILRVPFPVMFLIIGIVGPFCEEFVFRGLIYGSYADQVKRAGTGGRAAQRGRFSAILLSALTFGLMHMNFNQAIYAFAIGILLALLVEAAGSLWASMFCHMFFNSFQVIMMYLSKDALGSAYAETIRETAEELTSADLQAALAVYLIIAAVTTPIACCCVVWIAKNEGRQEEMRALFYGQSVRKTGQRPQQSQPLMNGQLPQQPPMNGQPSQQPLMSGQRYPQMQESLLTVPLVVAVVLCLGYMSLELFLKV